MPYLQRMLALLALGAMLPVVLAAAVLGATLFQQQRAALQRQAHDHARFLAAFVGSEIAADAEALTLLTQSPAFDGDLDKERVQILSERFLAQEPLWRVISISDPSGVRLMDYPEPIGGTAGGRVVDIASHQAAAASQRTSVGRIMVGPQGRAAFAVRAPAVREGHTRYVVSAVIEPRAFQEILLARNVSPGWTATIVDGRGAIVASTQPGQAAAGALALEHDRRARAQGISLPYEGRDEQGRRTVAVQQAVTGLDWTIHVHAPRDMFSAPLVRSVWVLVAGLVLSLILGAGLVVLLRREARDRRQEELSLAAGHRLEALGRMTGGVAHDLNNLLTPIMGALDLLSRRQGLDGRSERLIQGALASAERAKTLVSRLLTFARRQTLEPRDVDVRALLDGVADMLERSVDSKVRLEVLAAPDVGSVRVDPGQLELALLNLGVNANHAMPDGGALIVSARRENVDPGSSIGLAPGPYVRFTVTDTGEGMDAHTLQHAVEPFFSTKPAGHGTGLGLSMVHGLAAQSGGALRLSSEPRQGSTVDMWLPAGGAESQDIAQPEPLRAGRSMTVLLVDDEDLVRAATAQMLTDCGHHVLQARSGGEALQLLAEEPQVGFLVTDHLMPGLTGAALVDKARSLRPDLPVLLITGYAGSASEIPDHIPRLAKPFRQAELVNRIAQLDQENLRRIAEAETA